MNKLRLHPSKLNSRCHQHINPYNTTKSGRKLQSFCDHQSHLRHVACLHQTCNFHETENVTHIWNEFDGHAVLKCTHFAYMVFTSCCQLFYSTIHNSSNHFLTSWDGMVGVTVNFVCRHQPSHMARCTNISIYCR